MVLSGHKGSVSCVRWGGTGFIYTASEDKTIKVWNDNNGMLAHTLTSHAHWVNHLALSTDFVLRTAYHDHTGQIPDTDEAKATKAKERYLKAATIQGEVVERLVSASDDFTMYLWEPSKSTKPIARMTRHQKQVNHVTFSPDGLLIASAGFDNHTKTWNARDGKFINTLRGHVAPVYQCCFSTDSRLLVTASKDTTLKMGHADTQTCKWYSPPFLAVKIPSSHLYSPYPFKYNAANVLSYSASIQDIQAPNTFKSDIFSVHLEQSVLMITIDLPNHQDEVYAVDWSPDGQKVGSGGKYKAVRVWRH